MMIKALYYPYVSVSTIETLKSALLLFDKVCLINPFDVSKDLITNHDRYVSFYRDSRIRSYIKFISPGQLLNNSAKDQSFCTNLINDLLDTGYQTFCNKLNAAPLSRLSISNISEIGLDVIQRKYYVNFPTITDGLSLQNRITKDSKDYEMYHKERLSFLRISDERKFIYDAKDNYKAITLPFEYVESLMINHALMVARDMGLLLFTDSDIDSSVLRFKLNKMNDSLRNFLYKNELIKSEKMDLNPVNLFDIEVPILSNISLDSIIEFYHQYRKTLEKFRSQIADFTFEMQNNYWDSDISNDIDETLNTNVKPSIREIFYDLESFKDKLPHSVKSSVEISATIITVTIFPGIGPEIALLLNKPFFSVEKDGDNYKFNNSRTKNGVAYLLKTCQVPQ